MPMEWLHILLHEKTVNKPDTLYNLKYNYTVDDVFDILETLEVMDCLDNVRERELKSKEKQGNANR